MEFLTWWFVDHWFFALAFSPFSSFLWALFSEYDFGWAALCLTCAVISAFIKP